MINYNKVARGDILEIVGNGAPGFAPNGDFVRVLKVHRNGVEVENEAGETVEFTFNCGAARLKPTEWRDDFRDAVHRQQQCDGVPLKA